MLQEVLGGGGTSKNAAALPSTADFDDKLTNFLKLSEKLEPEVNQLSKAINSAFNLMKRYLSFALGAKRPEKDVQDKLMAVFKAELQVTIDLEKNDKFRDHAKAMKQAGSAAFWVFVSDPKTQIESCIEAADYDANKFRKLKIPGHNEWYAALLQTLKALIAYASENFSSGANYDMGGKGDWNQFLAGDKQAPVAVQKPVATVEKKEGPAAQQQAPAPAVKPPVRELKPPNTWYVQNFANETVTFNAEEAEMKSSFIIENCKNVTVEITKSKIKNVIISKVEKLIIVLKDCVSGVEIMNSKHVDLKVLGWCPSIAVDASQAVTIVLNGENKNTDIVSSKSNQLNIAYTLP